MRESIRGLIVYMSKFSAVFLIAIGLLLMLVSLNYSGPIPYFWCIALFIMGLGLLEMIYSQRIIGIVASGILLFGCYLIQIIPRVNQKGDVINWAAISPGLTKMIFICTLIIALAAAFYAQYRHKDVTGKIKWPSLTFRKTATANEEEIFHPPVFIGKTNKGTPINITGKDRYLHTLLVGATGTGKTSAVLAPMVWQDLVQRHKGTPLGITYIAPNQEYVLQIKEWCDRLSIPVGIVDLDDPKSFRFNPLEGDPERVSEIMRTVLRSVFGEQDAFFSQAQELHAKNTMLLLKRLRGDNLSLLDVYQVLMNIDQAQDYVDQYISQKGEDILTTYFRKEAFGINKDKLHQFAMGLRLQISDLLNNETIYNVLVCKSDINLDRHMAEGGVLLFNTSLGKMGHMSQVFGQFLIMHIQNAVFRRPGTEFTRIPHYLYIDELPVYFNPELTRLFNLGRQYRCSCVVTIQSPSQLEVGKQGVKTRKTIIGGCRNKIVLGVEDPEDARLLSLMFGAEEHLHIEKRRHLFSILPESISEKHKVESRFEYTEILELPSWHGIVKVVSDGVNQKPTLAVFEEPWIFQDRIGRILRNTPRHQLLPYES